MNWLMWTGFTYVVIFVALFGYAAGVADTRKKYLDNPPEGK